MTHRLINIECWNCRHQFDYSTDIPEDHIFSVYCGICDAENVIDANPYRKKVEQVFRGSTDKSTEQTASAEYDFPNPIPGNKPEQNEKHT